MTRASSLAHVFLALVLCSLAAPPAHAEPGVPRYRLRVATTAPKGSAWAHEIDAFVEEVALSTQGELSIKVYYGGVAGNEIEMAERIQKGHLDGAISGGWMCRRVMPSMRVLGLVGLFQSREEATHVITALSPTLEKEAAAAGFVLSGTAGVGSVVIFSREPITSMETLRKTKLWRWEGEEVEFAHGKEMGLSMLASSLPDATKAYREGRVDGFFAVPMAALAFQWFAQARYLTDLKTGFLEGCTLITRGAFDKLPQRDRDAFLAANAKLIVRLEAVGSQQEDALLGGVFGRQGLKIVPVSPKFRAEFFDAARVARERLGDKLVPKELFNKVLELLADYRAEHATP